MEDELPVLPATLPVLPRSPYWRFLCQSSCRYLHMTNHALRGASNSSLAEECEMRRSCSMFRRRDSACVTRHN